MYAIIGGSGLANLTDLDRRRREEGLARSAAGGRGRLTTGG